MTFAKFSASAERDLASIHGYIAADDPTSADRVRGAILDTSDLLASNPAIGRRIINASERHAQIRWFVVPKYRNYLIFYRPFQNTILAIRVLHAAQDYTRFFPVPQKRKLN